MLKNLPLTFVQQALEQTLLEEHIKNNHLFGGKNQITLHSFYEQLKTQQDVDRFVETVRDLNDQQNRTGLIGNGVLLSPENPTITNLYSSIIIPFTWTCSIRTTLGNRDQMIETLQNLIEKLKGRKCDMAQLECFDENNKVYFAPFKVGTLGQNDGQPTIKSGDFIGSVSQDLVLDTQIKNKITTLLTKDFSNAIHNNDFLYFDSYSGSQHILSVAQKKTISSQNIEVENWNIEEAYYDQVGGGIRRANGKISFESVESGYTEIPQNLQFTMKVVVYDGTNTQLIDTDLSLDYNSEYTYLDNNGRIHFLASYSFSLVESEWDFGSIDLEIDQINEIPFEGYVQIEDDNTYPDIVFPQEHTNFEKFKLSMSFDSFRIDEPHNLNGSEYCEISFGGSATLCNENVYLGNDLVKVGVQKNKILADTPITFSGATTYYLEPLEMPSGLNANTQINQLISNNFKQNTHTDGTAGVLQYSFIIDKSFDILKQWFDYARFGTYGITASDICPNLIYNVSEIWSSWGDVENHTMLCKITESIDIENTESDVLTLGVNFQIQGENN